MSGRDSSPVLALLSQGLATVCGCLLALMLALSLTLFREGYYLHKLDTGTCLQTIYVNIQQGGQTIARAAGLREDIFDDLVTQEDVRVAVVRRADEIWHGATAQPETPYTDLVAYLQDTVSRKTGVAWTESDTDRYDTIRRVCDDMWTSNAVPPMANLLNVLMQYRQIAWVLMVILAVLLAFCLWLQVPFQAGWPQLPGAVATVGKAIAVGCVLICFAIQFSGWKTWMPSEDAAYGLYFSWFRGFAPVAAACGMMLAVVLWVIALLLAQYNRTAGKRPVQPVKDKEELPL